MQGFKVPSLSQFKITWLPCEYILQISIWSYLFKSRMPASIRKWNLNTNSEYIWTTSCKSVITNMAIMRCFAITTWSRVLLEKLTGSQLVKKFPTFYETRRFITAFTSSRHLSLFWASSIQSVPPHPTFWRTILILFSHLRLDLPRGHFPSGLPIKTLYNLFFTHACYMPRPSHSSRCDHPNGIGWGVQIIKPHIMQFSSLPCYLVPPPALILCLIILMWRVLVFLYKNKITVIIVLGRYGRSTHVVLYSNYLPTNASVYPIYWTYTSFFVWPLLLTHSRCRGYGCTWSHSLTHTPLDEGSALCRDICVTTHKIQSRHPCPWRDSNP